MVSRVEEPVAKPLAGFWLRLCGCSLPPGDRDPTAVEPAAEMLAGALIIALIT